MTYFSVIYAIEKHSKGFCKNLSLPWKISSDLKHFKSITSKVYKKDTKNILIMGKNTYLSKPSLSDSNRTEIVLTKSGDNKEKYFTSLENYFEYLKSHNHGKIFVIGGKNLIESCYKNPYCEEIIVSYIEFTKSDFNPFHEFDTFLDDKDLELYHNTFTQKTIDFCQYNQCNVNVEFKVYNKYKTSERNYLNLIRHVVDEGEYRKDRTGTGTVSIFGPQFEIDISRSFPLLTSKKVTFKNILTEVLWFLSGSTNTTFLKQNNVNIWDGNTTREFLDKRCLVDYEVGDIGPLYGYQWRNFGGDFKDKNSKGVDQIQRMLDILRTDPNSRRIFMSAWNPVDLDKMVLEPCHVSFQLYVSESKYLHGKLYMRSNDLFLGAPWNIAGYSLLIYMFAHLTGYQPGKLVYTIGDAHIYSNHINQVNEQLSRPLRPFPKLKITKECKTFEDFDMNSFEIIEYDPHPFIKADMAV